MSTTLPPRQPGTTDDPPLGFGRSDVIRHTSEQGDGALDLHRSDPAARTVVLDGATVLVADGSALHELEALDGLVEGATQVLLGSLAGAPVLATAMDAEQVAVRAATRSGCATVDLRSLAMTGGVPEAELGLLAQARSLLTWHATHGFCARCGAATRLTCAGARRDCDACGAQHFPRTDPVVIMLVSSGDSCLLGRQRQYPQGSYSCLAGFVEPGETIEAAVVRETLEEAGVHVGAVRYLRSQPWPFTSQLMIGCAAEAVSPDLHVDLDELEDARWFPRDEVRAMLAGTHPNGLVVPPPVAIAHHLIRDFAAG